MTKQTRWFVLAVCALIVFSLLALTALDKQDEQACEDRAVASRSVWPHACDGFLPW